MRLTDNNNVSNGITDRNSVYMEYIGVEVLRCDCFTQRRNKFELTTPFFGKDSAEVARIMCGHSAYLHIMEDNTHHLDGVKCTQYLIESVRCVGEKIKLELTTYWNNLSNEEKQNEADKISNTRFRFVTHKLLDGISYDFVMVRVKD